MYICPMYSSELLKGTLKTIILQLLKEKGRMYGYEMTQWVKETSKDQIQITEGALYPLLHALEANGDVETETEYVGKRVRKYYRLTSQGKKNTKKKVSELESFMETIQLLLHPKKRIHGIA